MNPAAMAYFNNPELLRRELLSIEISTETAGDIAYAEVISNILPLIVNSLDDDTLREMLMFVATEQD